MALHAIDGFDLYENVSQVTTRSGWLQWTRLVNATDGSAPTALVQGRFTGLENKALNVSNYSGGGQIGLLGSFGANMKTSFIGFAAYLPAQDGQGDHTMYVSVLDTATGAHIPIVLSQSDGSISTPFGRSTNNKFPLDTWFFVEIGTSIDSSNGFFVVRISGVEQFRATGNIQHQAKNIFDNDNPTSTPNSYVNGIAFFLQGVQRNLRLDDFYFCDDTTGPGPNPCNTFLGDRRVLTLKLNGPGDLTQWTPFGATNWENAAVADGDISYNATSVAGSEDLFVLGPLPAGVATILAVQVTGVYKKDEAASHTLTQRAKSAGVEAAGPGFVGPYPLTSTYAVYSDLFMVDPSTSAAWTPAAINSLQIGYRLES